eukprot:Unigene468_Nuclearia_a/m.1518 Unigene468_Nuclearia_a/g.1518  ORF Unigene468_Nuclearia_a/g.1518 Unigene468_Nuclearia_a/m.1518 type:complete len:356 (+) Unigene468_Nuclearia_a:628-1695(+)
MASWPKSWPGSIPREVHLGARYLLGLPGPGGYGSGATGLDVARDNAERIRGRVVLITGATSGIGLETARALAAFDAELVLGVRDLQRGADVAQELQAAHASVKVHLLRLDVSSMGSVSAAARAMEQLGLPLHVLINNAGVMGCPLSYTQDGFETQWATNFLGPFYLTWLLLPLLLRSATAERPARVVNVSSGASQQATDAGVDFDNLDGRRTYVRQGAYAQSKFAQILHARELNRRAQAAGVPLEAFSLHPGTIPTSGVTREYDPYGLTKYVPSLGIFKSCQQGASTVVFCAFDPRATRGEYHSDCAVGQVYLHPRHRDMTLAHQLWDESERLLQPVVGSLPETGRLRRGGGVTG